MQTLLELCTNKILTLKISHYKLNEDLKEFLKKREIIYNCAGQVSNFLRNTLFIIKLARVVCDKDVLFKFWGSRQVLLDMHHHPKKHAHRMQYITYYLDHPNII